MINQLLRFLTSPFKADDYPPHQEPVQFNPGTEQTHELVDNRQLFYRLMHPESSAEVLQIARHRLTSQLNDIEGRQSQDKLFSGHPERLRAEIERLKTSTRIELNPDVGLRGLIRQYAPFALVEMSWLQSVSHAAQAHTETSALLFRIYSGGLGLQTDSQTRFSLFKHVLADFSILVPDPCTWLFASNPGFIQSSFASPVTSLCLAQLPVSYLPEILGYTLAHCFELSTCLQWIRLQSETTFEVPESLRHYLDTSYLEHAGELALQAVDACINNQQRHSHADFWRRLSHGVLLYMDVERQLYDVVRNRTVQIQSVWRQFQRTQKSGEGSQSSAGGVTLCGNQLDDWFTHEPLLARQFVLEIVHADNPDYQHAGMRRFFSASSVFHEDHFTRADYQALRQLADQLQTLEDSSESESNNDQRVNNLFVIESLVDIREANATSQRYDTRQLYYALLNLERYPQCLDAAHVFVSNQLKKSRSVMRRIRPVHQRLIEFSLTAFDQQIQAIYQAEADQYKEFIAPPRLSRDGYRWGIEQFAPVLLVDGSWLQNSAKAGNVQHPVTRFLTRIYADEIGDGRSDWNHANVYRKLLESERIALPEFTSKAFSEHPGFIDTAFDLPVFFLAISQFSSTFEAEIIGLNLAIELSGLGSTYRRLVDELDYWDIDSTIVSLHLSIDNLATGHAALAHDAVTVYLDRIYNAHGYAEMQRHWQRIWSGYLTLHTVPGHFKRMLIWNYFKRFIARSLITPVSSMNR